MRKLLGYPKLFSTLLVFLPLFAFVSFFLPKPTFADTEVCFCHNLEHNPITICTDNEGLINGHMADVNNGTDSLGECPDPTDTPEPTGTAKPSDTPEPTDTPKPSDSPDPTQTPKPSVSPEPTDTPKPSDSPEPTDTPKPSASASATPCPTSGCSTCQTNCGGFSGGLFGGLTSFLTGILGINQPNYNCQNNYSCNNQCPSPSLTPKPTKSPSPSPSCYSSNCGKYDSGYSSNYKYKFFR